MYKVTMYSYSGPDIRISMEMYFTPEGCLFFEGYDIGKNVKDYWGDSDYEYTYSIAPDEVNKIYDLFHIPKGRKRVLLRALRDRFGGQKAYSEFGDFLEEHQIGCSGFTYA